MPGDGVQRQVLLPWASPSGTPKSIKKLLKNRCQKRGPEGTQMEPQITPKSCRNQANIIPTSCQSHPKIIPKSSQNHPKVTPKPSQSHPKVIPKSSQSHHKVVPTSSRSRPKVDPKSSGNLVLFLSITVPLNLSKRVLSILYI